MWAVTVNGYKIVTMTLSNDVDSYLQLCFHKWSVDWGGIFWLRMLNQHYLELILK